ncbi:MAG: hypothetical protein II789_01430, partial [Clostridia bacterium]|nr:hypothetical protein [Clostridia bacterium]
PFSFSCSRKSQKKGIAATLSPRSCSRKSQKKDLRLHLRPVPVAANGKIRICGYTFALKQHLKTSNR